MISAPPKIFTVNFVKIAILVENYFEDVELLYPYYRLKEAGYEIDVVGPKAGEVYKGKKGGSIQSTAAPEDINLDEYAGIIIPGGWAQTTCGPAPAS